MGNAAHQKADLFLRRRGVLQSKSIEQYSEELKENFDIRGVSDDDSIRGMSGGNLQKIVLAREISRGP